MIEITLHSHLMIVKRKDYWVVANYSGFLCVNLHSAQCYKPSSGFEYSFISMLKCTGIA